MITKGSKAFKTEYNKRVIKAKADEFTKTYSNQLDANPLFNGHTVQTDLDVTEDAPENTFYSKLGETEFGVTNWDGQQFNFHAGSEHTVDGVRHDFEMHTVHYPREAGNDGVIAAAMGIMFSVENYTAKLSWAEERIIDTFFDTLRLDDVTELGPTVSLATYGDLMMMVDMNNRWVYKGSVTTPPCAQGVYWNVLSTIYPIKAEHLALFTAQLDRGEEGELGTRGNWRVAQTYNDEAHFGHFIERP